MFRNFDNFITKIISNEKVFVVISIVTFLAIFLVAIGTPVVNLKVILQDVALLNVTIAIGMGTLVSAIGSGRENIGIIGRMILLILIGVLGHFVAEIPNYEWTQRGYLLLEGIVVLMALSGTLRFFIETYEFSDRRSSVSNKKRPKQ